jgi:hypothetical protein
MLGEMKARCGRCAGKPGGGASADLPTCAIGLALPIDRPMPWAGDSRGRRLLERAPGAVVDSGSAVRPRFGPENAGNDPT